MLLYKDEYLIVNLLEVQKLMSFKFNVFFFDPNLFKNKLLKFKNKMVYRKARLFLIDLSNVYIKFTTEIYDWFDSVVLPHIAEGNDLRVAWICTNQEIELLLQTPFAIHKLFNNNQEAMSWLLPDASNYQFGKIDKHKHSKEN